MSVTQRIGRSGRWVEIGVFLAILATAAFLRFTQLNTVPPGMTHDEAAFGAEAEQVLSGERPLYFGLGYGHEPVYAYLVAAAFAIAGPSLAALRITSAVCGLLVLLGTCLVSRRMFGLHVAWLAAAWMAVAFWPLSLSRQALRAITLPMLWLPAAWLFWRALADSGALTPSSESRDTQPAARRGLARFALSGAFLGASFYTYMASRVTWIVYPLFALYLLLRKETRSTLKQIWPGLLVALLVAGLVALPLFVYLQTHPEAEKRFEDMMGPIRELVQGKPSRVLRHAWNAVRVFSWVGDQFWAYNIPGRPVFGWAGALLFYAGLCIALWRWQDPRYAFVLVWLIVGLSPALVTTNEGIFLRAVVAQPATYILVAIGLTSIGAALRGLRDRVHLDRPWLRAGGYLLAAALVTVEGVRTYQAYFVDWPSQPAARNIYNHNLVAASRYLRSAAQGEQVGVSALAPLYYHDPWILRYVAGRSDLRVRWFDGRGGIVYPQSGEARYVFSALTTLDPVLRAEFESQATLVERVELAESDQNPYFEVWRWRGSDALAAHLDALEAVSPMWVSPEVQFTQPELRQRLQAPVRCGDLMELVGYQLNGESFGPGDPVELITCWRALRTVNDQNDWDTFVHLLDRNSAVIGSTDVLDCPPSGWYPGDVVVQVHRFIVDSDAEQGEAYLEVGVYRHSTGRLPVQVDGATIGDRVLLAPVQVQ